MSTRWDAAIWSTVIRIKAEAAHPGAHFPFHYICRMSTKLFLKLWLHKMWWISTDCGHLPLPPLLPANPHPPYNSHTPAQPSHVEVEPVTPSLDKESDAYIRQGWISGHCCKQCKVCEYEICIIYVAIQARNHREWLSAANSVDIWKSWLKKKIIYTLTIYSIVEMGFVSTYDWVNVDR